MSPFGLWASGLALSWGNWGPKQPGVKKLAQLSFGLAQDPSASKNQAVVFWALKRVSMYRLWGLNIMLYDLRTWTFNVPKP